MLDVQKDLRERLARALAPVPVAVSVPADRPAELVTVRRVGGSERNALVDSPTVALECRAATEARACELAAEAAEAMRSLPFPGGYADVRQEAMYSDRDMVADVPRWCLSYSLKTYQPRKKEGN